MLRDDLRGLALAVRQLGELVHVLPDLDDLGGQPLDGGVDARVVARRRRALGLHGPLRSLGTDELCSALAQRGSALEARRGLGPVGTVEALPAAVEGGEAPLGV